MNEFREQDMESTVDLSESPLAHTAQKYEVKKIDIAVKVDGLDCGKRRGERSGISTPEHDNRQHP